MQFIEAVKNLGFSVNSTSQKCKSFNDVIDFCNEFQEKRNEKHDFERLN